MEEVNLFSFTQNMADAVVIEWLVDDGAAVEAGQDLVEVESEKATQVIPAPADGVVSIRVDEGEQVDVGTTLAVIDADDEADATAPVPTTSSRSADEQSTARAVAGSGVRASPAARHLAREHDLDLATLSSDGRGPDGAFVERDVAEAIEAGIDAEPSPSGAEVAAGRAIYEERSGGGIRQTIADRMTESAREIPQVTLTRHVSVTSMLAIKDRLAADRNLDASVIDFVVAAVAEALAEHPEFNAVYEDGVHKLARNVNVGVAVDIDRGLITPVIRNADRRSLADLGEARSRLVARVQRGDYTMDDLADGTFTITNLGGFGVDTFDPLVNPPEVAILGVGTIRTVVDPETGERDRQLPLSLSFDHRPVDGADAARFLDSIADALAHPLRLVGDGGGRSVGTRGGVETGDGDGRSAIAHSSDGLTVDVRARGFEWTADEPPEMGGGDAAPTPVEGLLGSLCSCLAISVRRVADRRDVVIDGIDVAARAAPEEGPIERIAVDLEITAAADRETVEKVARTAERACLVSRALDGVDQTVDLTIRTP